MNRRKLLKTLLVLAAVVWLALNLDGKPGAPPVHGEALKMLQAFAPDFNIKQALDVIPLGNKHLFVPYEDEDGNRGNSFMAWERFKWRVARVSTDTSPVVWHSGLGDHAKKAIVWNLAPGKNITELSLYFIVERNAGSSGNHDLYFPRIQMERKISPDNMSYGVLPFPEEWEQFSKLPEISYVGWIHRYENKAADPSAIVNSSSRSISNGMIVTRNIRPMDEAELE